MVCFSPRPSSGSSPPSCATVQLCNDLERIPTRNGIGAKVREGIQIHEHHPCRPEWELKGEVYNNTPSPQIAGIAGIVGENEGSMYRLLVIFEKRLPLRSRVGPAANRPYRPQFTRRFSMPSRYRTLPIVPSGARRRSSGPGPRRAGVRVSRSRFGDCRSGCV